MKIYLINNKDILTIAKHSHVFYEDFTKQSNWVESMKNLKEFGMSTPKGWEIFFSRKPEGDWVKARIDGDCLFCDKYKGDLRTWKEINIEDLKSKECNLYYRVVKYIELNKEL